jgi:hypothetical protein
MRPIDAYIAELRTSLGNRLDPAERQSRLREVRSHLEEAARAEGETIALGRFGPPVALARAILRQAKGYDSRTAASLSRRSSPATYGSAAIRSRTISKRSPG